MSLKVEPKLLFLPPKTAATHTSKSKRQLELEDQEARAHAARVAFYRASLGGAQRHRGRNSTHALSEEVSTDSRQRLPARKGSVSPRTNQNQSNPEWTSQGLAWIKTGPLDPFLRLASDLSMHERNMLFYYLDTTPGLVHGVKKDAVFCPVRDCTAIYLATSPLTLQWIILFIEMRFGVSKTAIYTRRAAIYAETRQMLQTLADFLNDETVLHLLVATTAEGRLGNHKLAEKHFKGILQILQLRNGLRTLQEVKCRLGFSMLHNFVVGQLPLFRTREELLDALGRMSLPRAKKPVPLPIRRYFEPFSFEGAHIGNLHMLNMIMEKEPEGYMDRLLFNITGSGDELRPVAITFMIGQSAVDVGGWYGPNPIVRSWETVEFVRMLTYAVVSKEATVKALSSWLTGQDCPNVDLGDLKAEILDGWDFIHSFGELKL